MQSRLSLHGAEALVHRFCQMGGEPIVEDEKGAVPLWGNSTMVDKPTSDNHPQS